MTCVKSVQVLLINYLVLWMCSGSLFAQSSTDTAFSNTLKVFTNALADQSPVFNGKQYRRYPEYIHYGQPFFTADSLVKGTVTYNGLTYERIPLQLDEVNDQLITADWQGNNLVQLPKQHIQAFTIGTDKFIHYTGGFPQAGYYRVIYDGKSKMLARETKHIQVKTGRTRDETERTVISTSDYYLLTGKGYEKFSRLNSFLNLLGSRRKEVARFIKDRRLRFRNKDQLLPQAAAYYDQIN